MATSVKNIELAYKILKEYTKVMQKIGGKI